MKPTYFKFYESCVPVVGINRGVVYDLIRGNLYFFPKQVLQEFITYSAFEITQFYLDFEGSENILKKYFNYLLENELIFFLDNHSRFPKINTSIMKPYSQDVLFLEIDEIGLFKEKFLDNGKIRSLGFTNVVLISFKNSYKNLSIILKILENSRISNVRLLMKYELNISEKLEKITKNSYQTQEIIIFDSEQKLNNALNETFVYYKGSLDDLLTKRVWSINNFVLNQNAYFEALEKNLYFNRKIYIENKGNIKHSFDDNIVYGNLKTDLIETVIMSNNFKELWDISKDKIEVCRDCEFRYICPDNRIPEKRNKNNYFHKTLCNYDPYKNEWKEN